jgi:8-oxo-dGTP diphosphatase
MAAKPFSLSVKAVVFDSQNRCLLIRRSAHNKNFIGKWEWPGGKVDPGEDFAATVVREMREETALEVEIVGLAGVTQFEMTKANVVLLCMETRTVSGEIKLSDEHDDFAWVPLEEFPKWALPEQIAPFMLEYAARKSKSKNP